MKIKNTANRTQEIVYMSIASFLALCLIFYLIYIVRSISQKASIVFGPEELSISDSESLQFDKYDKLMERLYPGSTTVLSTFGVKATTTVIVATTTVSTSTLAPSATTTEPAR
jgi:ABC-type maltose transport system permease subunit